MKRSIVNGQPAELIKLRALFNYAEQRVNWSHVGWEPLLAPRAITTFANRVGFGMFDPSANRMVRFNVCQAFAALGVRQPLPDRQEFDNICSELAKGASEVNQTFWNTGVSLVIDGVVIKHPNFGQLFREAYTQACELLGPMRQLPQTVAVAAR